MLAAILLLATQAVWADGPWEGFWEACSSWEAYNSGEDAYLSLRQDGDRVVGTHFPYNGQLEGRSRCRAVTTTSARAAQHCIAGL